MPAPSPWPEDPRRPLVVRFGALGDMVLIKPLIERLAERYRSKVDLLGSGPWTSELLSGQPKVGEIRLIRSRKTPYWLSREQWRLVEWLRAREGPVYFCDDTEKTRWLLQRAGIGRERMVDAYEGYDPKTLARMHWLEQWRAVAERSPPAFPAPSLPVPPPMVPRIALGEEAERDLKAFLHERGIEPPFVLFQPGNKRTLKRGLFATQSHPKFWPLDRWVRLGRTLLAVQPGLSILLCGVARERRLCRQIARGIGDPRVHVLAGELPLMRLAALCAQAHSMIAVDSGPAHLAAAMGTPLVVLFGHAAPERWRPVGPPGTPIIALGGPHRGGHVQAVSMEEVAAAWSGLSGMRLAA